jgi:hypothetical protein
MFQRGERMLNLGKLLLFTIFTTKLLLGDVSAELEKDVIVQGTEARLTVTAYGDNIESPRLVNLGGTRIKGISTESFYNSINGVSTSGKRFHYRFAPDQNSTIESLKFVIDGVVEETKPLKIYVVEPNYSSSDPFFVKISTDKKSYYQGEPIQLEVEYVEDLAKDVVDRRYTEPSGDGLWEKHKSGVKERKDKTKYYINMSYVYSAQQSGELQINSAQMKIGTRVKRRDSWGFFFESAKWSEIVSNSLKLNIKPSPEKIVGDFQISTIVDKDSINSGDSVNLTLTIEGAGNIEDIEPFKISLQNGIVYDEKPEVKQEFRDGRYYGVFTQKFALILDKNSTIPQVQLQYFNPEKEKIVIKRTPSIDISVNQPENPLMKSEKLEIERGVDKSSVVNDVQTVETVVDKTELYIVAVISFLGGSFLTALLFISPLKKFGVWKKFRKLLNRDRELMKKALAKLHSDSEIVEVAEKLNSRIYRGEKVKISKQEIQRLYNVPNKQDSKKQINF